MTDVQLVVPMWAWIALTVAIVAMLAVDLFLHRDNHVVEFKEAAIWSAIWIAAGLGFGVIVWWAYGGDVAGPAFSQIAGGALRTLGIPPDAPIQVADARDAKEKL